MAECGHVSNEELRELIESWRGDRYDELQQETYDGHHVIKDCADELEELVE